MTNLIPLKSTSSVIYNWGTFINSPIKPAEDTTAVYAVQQSGKVYPKVKEYESLNIPFLICALHL